MSLSEELAIAQNPGVTLAILEKLKKENKKLKELVGEYDQSLGSIGLFLTRAEYSKALKEYHLACDAIDLINKEVK